VVLPPPEGPTKATTCPGSTSYFCISSPYLSCGAGSPATLSGTALLLEFVQLTSARKIKAHITFLIPETIKKTCCGCKDKPHFLIVDKFVEKSGKFCKKM
jgi:hypothetical protein